jgi:hypothetical protein
MYQHIIDSKRASLIPASKAAQWLLFHSRKAWT